MLLITKEKRSDLATTTGGPGVLHTRSSVSQAVGCFLGNPLELCIDVIQSCAILTYVLNATK